MTTRAVFVLLIVVLIPASPPALSVQDDRDTSSIELVVRGCLKGRELTADEISGSPELEGEIGTIFRLSGRRAVGDDIKRQNGHRVEVTGLVKKTALATPGFKIGGGRIVIGSGGPMSTDPTRNPARNPSRRIVPMDATIVEMLAEKCPSPGKS
jgi:hypothetical protein